MKTEIGSEFWDIPLTEKPHNFFCSVDYWFLSGRIALRYIIADSGIKSVAMPDWCCESMTAPFEEAGVEIEYYGYDQMPSFNSNAVFIMDYFGYSGRLSVPEDYRGVIIRDVTHSLFSKEYSDADYYFGSLRKWTGFWTGGFAWGNWKKTIPLDAVDEHYVELRKTAMERKAAFIKGKTESKDYLRLFNEAEEYLDTVKGFPAAAQRDIDAATRLDYEGMKKIRRKNAEYLQKQFKSEMIFDLRQDDCPLFVPIQIGNRDRLRKFLIDNNIYIPVHWPGNDLAGTELSLICDQRYNIDDMKHMTEVIDAFNL